jgi:phosphatidylserine/phosphatidylglycerophosphate/cardiolipin synthase-like enzyme
LPLKGIKNLIGDDLVVQTGSLNWSENSELKTFENLVTLWHPGVVGQYVKRFELKWKYGSGRANELLEEVKKANGNGPCNFKPVTLTGRQLAA